MAQQPNMSGGMHEHRMQLLWQLSPVHAAAAAAAATHTSAATSSTATRTDANAAERSLGGARQWNVR